jgi:hypothetical protein
MHFVKNKYHERPERNGAMQSVPGMLILDRRPSDQKILNRLIKFNTIAPAFTFINAQIAKLTAIVEKK